MAAAPRLHRALIALAAAFAAGGAAAQEATSHWAFTPPVRPALPPRGTAAAAHPIDAFLEARLAEEGLRPQPEADRATLLRRVTLALTGLPPTLAELDAFVADDAPGAYRRVVTRLLASPHYGEHMARWWLDLARYADTDGYHIDGHRDMWKWRDWVIAAFNANKPFDEFTLEQLAGDLIQPPSIDRLIATGFNRNNMTNIEGGADPDEYAVRYVVDRVNTTSTVWLGLTMKCAECHDHKYDPFTQKDYYRLYAFFANIPENGLDGFYGNAAPYVLVPSEEQAAELARLQREIAEKDQRIEALGERLAAEQTRWEQELTARRIDPDVGEGLALHYPLEEVREGEVAEVSGQGRSAVVSGAGTAQWVGGVLGNAVRLDGIGTHVECGEVFDPERTDAFSISVWVHIDAGGSVVAKLDDSAGKQGFDLTAMHRRVAFTLAHRYPEDALEVATGECLTPSRWHHVLVTYDGSARAAGAAIWVDGVRQPTEARLDALAGTTHTSVPLRIGRREVELGYQGLIDDVRIYRRALAPADVERLALAPVLRVLERPAAERTPAQLAMLRDYHREHVSPTVRGIVAEKAPLLEQQRDLLEKVPTTMVMAELPEPRPSYVLTRGDYRAKGERVTAGVPAALPPLPDGAPANRLGLARWLTKPDHPLTARVTVNRLWERMFGTGLVKTSEDFGTRGEPPTHPQLLDWLAVELVESGWDVKHMLELMATSAAFRRCSSADAEALERDPSNRLLARGPRLRLAAEAIRDNALAISGLLDARIGGPSVRPYQPPGLWEELAFGGGYPSQVYEPSSGADLYRRGLYVYWKRSSPYASFRIFDAPTRETCTVSRPVTNTPLQALALLNDPVYVEAARALAARVLVEGGRHDRQRIEHAIRLCVARAPRDGELRVLSALLAEQRARFGADPDGAAALLEVGPYRAPPELPPTELAAWTVVANLLLNTSEVITRP